MLDRAVAEEDELVLEGKNVDDVLALVIEALGGELEGRFSPSPAPPADELLSEGQAEQDAKALEDEPKEEELEELARALGL